MFFSDTKLDGEVLAEVGIKLKSLRKAKRWSQAELAQRIGVSRKHIVDIEAGRGTTLLVFVKLIKEFGKTQRMLEILSISSLSPKDEFNKENR